MANMTDELSATRQAAQSALEVSSAAQRELSALKRRAPSSASKPAPKFRSPGLEKQLEVNSSVLETIDAALDTLPPELLRQRPSSKLVSLLLSHGWEVVRQYEAGTLGDFAEDDRRIASAAVSAH